MHNRNKDLLGLSFEQCYDYNYTFVHEMPYLWSMRGLGMANCPVLPPSKVFGQPKVTLIMSQAYALLVTPIPNTFSKGVCDVLKNSQRYQ